MDIQRPEYIIDTPRDEDILPTHGVKFGLAQEIYTKKYGNKPKIITLKYSADNVDIFNIDGVVIKISSKLGPEAKMLRMIKNNEDIPAPELYYFSDNYLIMENIEGDNILSIHTKLSENEMSSIFTDLRKILKAMKKSNIIHGDLMPSNIIVKNGRISGIVDWERSHIGYNVDSEISGFENSRKFGFEWWYTALYEILLSINKQ